MRTFNTWNLTLCSAFFFTLSFGATGCDEEQGELADVRLVHGTHVAASRAASDSAPAAVERKAPLEPSKSPTKPWEPGNGYFDLVDSETYYDSCPPDNAAPGFEYVVEVEVDPNNKELNTYSIYTAFPDGVQVFDEHGDPIELGERATEDVGCEYNGLYAECPRKDSVLDLSFFNPALDARVKFSTKRHQLWQFGQDGYHVLETLTRTCEGENCDDPFVAAVVGDPVECNRLKRNEYDRVPAPTI